MTQNNQNLKKGMFPYAMLLVIGLALLFFYSMTNDMNKELTYKMCKNQFVFKVNFRRILNKLVNNKRIKFNGFKLTSTIFTLLLLFFLLLMMLSFRR